MSFIGNAIGKVVGGVTGASQAADAAERAAATQAQSAQLGIDEQKRQFDALQALLKPYVQAGTGALTEQQDLIGLNGRGAQQTAINGIQASPQFQAMQQQGQNAILQNASATGGLRGGNVQGALAQFSPRLLSQLIEQQYSRLGGITALGQNAAAGTGNAGMQTGGNIANLLQQQGAALAGGELAQGGVARAAFGDLLKVGSTIAGMGGFGGGGMPTGGGGIKF